MNFFACFAILAAAIALSESFLNDSPEENVNDDRIVGGETANPGQFPYQVSLRTKIRMNNTMVYRHRCGGSIISKRWIISAAHCTQGKLARPTRMMIVAGAHHFQNDGRIYYLKRIVNHPKFNRRNLKNDICLLQTRKAIEFHKRVRAIRLNKQFVGANETSILSGWGTTQVFYDRNFRIFQMF